MHKLSLFIFRQDLRTHDNTALREALENSHTVFPIFIHDIRAIEEFGENDSRFSFIHEALDKIDNELQKHSGRLIIYQGKPEEIVRDIIKQYSIDAIYLNRSYSPRGKERDTQIEILANQNGIGFFSFQDFLLVEPPECEQRKVFTPFSLLWKKFIQAHPERLTPQETSFLWKKLFVPDAYKTIRISWANKHPYWTMDFWYERMNRDFSRYEDERNTPSIDGSTRLSPYIRFGIFSIREVYAKVKENPVLLSEIIWREFWYHITYYFPSIYELEFQEKRRHIRWENDAYMMKKIEMAETGYPLIDAALRQLYETNWMHNRLRMVVASFITKNCLIDWRWGEKLFKKYLIDYDEAVNYGNWQWSASVWPDPKPLRIFNPLLQSEKFDTEAKFIKKYLPELQNIDPKRIHTLDLEGVYYRPIVNQRESANLAKERYMEFIS